MGCPVGVLAMMGQGARLPGLVDCPPNICPGGPLAREEKRRFSSHQRRFGDGGMGLKPPIWPVNSGGRSGKASNEQKKAALPGEGGAAQAGACGKLIHHLDHLYFVEPFNVAGTGANILGGDKGNPPFIVIQSLTIPLKENNDALAYRGIE